jgi:uracil-DNA glycosylase
LELFSRDFGTTKFFKVCDCLRFMDKKELLDEIEKEILEDRELPLRDTAINLVFGKGNPNTSIVFVGEAPGKNEDEEGVPFVGASGKNLDKLLEKVGLSMGDVYIANILKYRPPENRDPTTEEIEKHTPYLLKQIVAIKPKVVCSLGNYATKFFMARGKVEEMDKQEGITKVHGKVKNIEVNGQKIKLIPLFHPAAIIYKRALTDDWERDMEIVKEELEKKTLF